VVLDSVVKNDRHQKELLPVVEVVVGMKYRLNLYNQKKNIYKEEDQLVLVNANLFSTESGKLH